jgi:hypothetical protein
MALVSPPDIPVSLAREGRDEQHMNPISKKKRQLEIYKMPLVGADLPPVLPEGQPALPFRKRRLANIVVLLPQAARGN